MDAKRLSDYGKSSNNPSFSTVKSTSVLEAMYNRQQVFNPLGGSVLPRDVASGTYGGSQSVGGKNVNINGGDKNITMNDGTNDRLLIGFQQGGF